MQGYVQFLAKIPANGWYIIDVYASGMDRASLYTIPGVKLTTWNPATSMDYHSNYTTLQFLAQGYHYFKFKPDYYTSAYCNVVSIRITWYR
jgi:hypothetical protein